MTTIKALTFDTGGTILDWHSGLTEKLSEIGTRRGVEADWSAVTHDFRIRTLMQMTGGEPNFRPGFNMDDVHRQQIEEVAKDHGLSGFMASDFDEVRDHWHTIACWPDVPDGLSRLRSRFIVASLTILSLRLIIDTCKRAGVVWDAVISCETIGAYKPRPESYLTAAKWLQLEPHECMMVASHKADLAAAAAVGFQTAFVRRPAEWGPGGEPDFMKNEFEVTHDSTSFLDLADQLECP